MYSSLAGGWHPRAAGRGGQNWDLWAAWLGRVAAFPRCVPPPRMWESTDRASQTTRSNSQQRDLIASIDRARPGPTCQLPLTTSTYREVNKTAFDRAYKAHNSGLRPRRSWVRVRRCPSGSAVELRLRSKMPIARTRVLILIDCPSQLRGIFWSSAAPLRDQKQGPH